MNKTKRMIFECAMRLFSQKGYDSTSVEEITAVSGVAKGTLYYHFESKEEMLDILLEEGFKLLKNSIEIKTRNCKNQKEKIQEIILIQIKTTIKYSDFLNIVFSQMWTNNEKGKKCKKYVFEYIKILEEIIQKGIETNEFYNGNVSALASGVFGVTCSSLIYRMKTNEILKTDVSEIDKIYKGYIQTVVRGLCK